MILVLTGTHEAGEIINMLQEQGYPVLAMAHSEYGKTFALAGGARRVESVSESPIIDHEFLLTRGVSVVIDATQPYPYPTSALFKELCEEAGLLYVRYKRNETPVSENPLIKPVYCWEDAARIAAQLGPTVFLTTGSFNLELFLKHNPHGNRIVVRVLPEHQIIKKCQELGIMPRDIVAMQGPYSAQLNRSIFKAYKASCIVTRDGGKKGGTDTKLAAALNLGIPVILIKRSPVEEKYQVLSGKELLRLLKQFDVK